MENPGRDEPDEVDMATEIMEEKKDEVDGVPRLKEEGEPEQEEYLPLVVAE